MHQGAVGSIDCLEVVFGHDKNQFSRGPGRSGKNRLAGVELPHFYAGLHIIGHHFAILPSEGHQTIGQDCSR